ncbi:hypothetical protein [Desulfohalovibrio reitneri]|uniref:hypothetical protein n=1 Tax=Desulfohalovibrio reitneri TaxID=1307759 RepID=UPI000AE2D8E1|nr:hypothetical protein [Desulfohalovibrio reitneri]
MSPMEAVKLRPQGERCVTVDLDAIPPEVTEADEEIFFRIISTDLTQEQLDRVAVPSQTHPKQENVLAVHWHPEFVPMDTIRRRVEAIYPNKRHELIIPTQHNELLWWDDYAGVEVDCYSSGFNRKVQLLLHFRRDRVEGPNQASMLKAMLNHTFKYRSSQLFDFMHAVTSPDKEVVRQKAARQTNTEADVVAFTGLYVGKIQRMLEDNWSRVPKGSIKNKLLRNFFDELRAEYDETLINHAQVYLKAIKKLVKAEFSLQYFYRATEIIEEARSLGAGIVIPHPEQFWPILLADYDVDGIEVWNPQSMEYTEFLIRAVNRQNEYCGRAERPLLIFMGDDCHMSEKVKDPEFQDKEKVAREIGLQPAWDDLIVRKSLILCGVSRQQVMDEYAERLG